MTTKRYAEAIAPVVRRECREASSFDALRDELLQDPEVAAAAAENRGRRTEADRWTTALGVPAGTEPEDAVRMVVERERAAAVAYLRQVDKIVPEWPPLDAKELLVWERGRRLADAAQIFADAIERGKHVRDGGDDA